MPCRLPHDNCRLSGAPRCGAATRPACSAGQRCPKMPSHDLSHHAKHTIHPSAHAAASDACPAHRCPVSPNFNRRPCAFCMTPGLNPNPTASEHLLCRPTPVPALLPSTDLSALAPACLLSSMLFACHVCACLHSPTYKSTAGTLVCDPMFRNTHACLCTHNPFVHCLAHVLVQVLSLA